MKLDAVCFGALNVDRLYNVDIIAKSEEEGVIFGVQEFPGGSAANTAVGLSRLDIKTGFIGKVASDKDGKLLLEEFNQEGVNTDGIVISDKGRSGSVIGFVDKKGNRALYLDPGVNNYLYIKEIFREYASNAKLLHLTSFAGTISFETQINLLEAVSGINITFDPGSIYARKSMSELQPIIEKCLAIIPNEIELNLLTGKKIKKGSDLLLKKGAKMVAVKLGKKGCYINNGEENFLVKPFKTKVVDTTGAGDAFSAGFLYGLLKKKSPKVCGILGNFVASKTIAKKGARNGLPRKEELPI